MSSTQDTPLPNEAEGVLTEALRICEGDRQETYGHPYDNYLVIREMWSSIAKVELTLDQCVMMMISLKMARYLTTQNRDSIVDIAGYCWVIEQIKKREGRPL